MSEALPLAPVDAVEVTIVVDTYVDVLMASGDGVRRWPRPADFFLREMADAFVRPSVGITLRWEAARG